MFRKLPALGLTAIAFAIASPALAQSESPPAPAKSVEGFGKRGTFVFDLTHLLGYTTDKIGDASLDGRGFFPNAFGPQLGFHGINDGGLTYGAEVGLWRVSGSGSGDKSIYLMNIGPRLGYAGSFEPKVGYWIRGGPTMLLAAPSSGDASYYFDLSIEAFGVFTPTEHFGVMFGPYYDVGVLGKSGSRDEKYSSFGFSVGLLADF